MIVPMKKAKIVFLKEDEQKVLKALQRIGELMIVSTGENQEPISSSNEEIFMQRSQKSLQVIKPYVSKNKTPEETYPVVDYEEFVNPNYDNLEVLKEIEDLDLQIAQLTSENDATKEYIKTMIPWSLLEGDLSIIYSSKYAVIHTGLIGLNQMPKFDELVSSLKCDVNKLGVIDDNQAILLVNWHEENDEIMEAIKSSGFMEVLLPNVKASVKDLIIEKEGLIKENLNNIELIKGRLSTLAQKEQQIKLFSDQMATESELKKTPVTSTIETIYVEGWCKYNKVDKVRKAIESVTDCYDADFSDPAEGEEAPTALENNKFVRNFESITDMYSRPNSKELDPNPSMSIWYWLIFGMMMGDVGYGLVLAVATLLFLKIKKPKGSFASLLKVFFLGSLTTIFWGVIFGSYFGVSDITINGELKSLALWFNPQNQPIVMLVFTLAIGVVHLCWGLVLKCIAQAKAGHLLDGILDNISWVIILIGLSLALTQFCANMIDPTIVIPPMVMKVGYIVAGVGAGIVLFTAGRAKKGIGKIIGGLGGLYGVTSYLSDILSYARILALAMSGAIIGYVMNLLAGMVSGGFGWIFAILIYIVGHVFNLAMSLLSAYVHDCRLQYIEFYGKFFEGGGVDFKPLSLQYNYIYEIKDKK